MNEFSKTQMGRKFFERDVPGIVDGLKKTVEVLDKGMKTMEEIARDLRNKRVGEEGWKIGQKGEFKDEIIFTACLDDGTDYSIGQIVHGLQDVEYFLYVDGRHVTMKGVSNSFDTFHEALEAMADEAGLD